MDHTRAFEEENAELDAECAELRGENAALRRDLAHTAAYARELEDRVLGEVERCAGLRASLQASLQARAGAGG